MWMLLGGLAIVATICNLVCYFSAKSAEITALFRFIGLSATALTVCDFYAQNKIWVLAKDWGALADVVPTTANMLWALVMMAILLNAISLRKK